MQNKSAIWTFTILLAIATVYILFHSWASTNFEKQARAYIEGEYGDSLLAECGEDEACYDEKVSEITRKYLRDSSEVVIIPVIGKTYDQVKQEQLNLGLDLQGGMHVTLEVSIPDLVLAMSNVGKNEVLVATIDEAKLAQQSSRDDFMSLFEDSWKGSDKGDLTLGSIFHDPDNPEYIPYESTDDEVLQVLKDVAQDAINNTENIIKKRIDRFGISQPTVRQESFSGRITVELPGVDDPERVRKNLKSTANLEFWHCKRPGDVAAALSQANTELGKSEFPEVYSKMEAIRDAAQAAAADTTNAAVADTTGGTSLEEQLVEEAQTDSLSLQEQRQLNPLFAWFTGNNGDPRSAVIGWSKPSDTAQVNRFFEKAEALELLPDDIDFYWSAKLNELTSNDEDASKIKVCELYAVWDKNKNGKAELDGKSISNAYADYDEAGRPAVFMTMDSETNGIAIWGEMTTEAAGDNQRPIAVVMDNLVYSAPSVDEPITTGSSRIRMGGLESVNVQLKEAEDLAGLLKAGSLPAPAKIVDEYTVGPTMGQENIERGFISFIIALIVILVYMIFYYRGAGIVSNIALIANMFFLIGALASLHAALTLPGIAGIVLTIGMAVDANVLIYERIREEMRHGKGLTAAVKDGYSKAYSAIVDANITTLLTAIILFVFGSGPIQGFATTLIIGIFTSLFSAIIITRLIFFNRLEKKKKITFSSSITKNWFTNLDFQFVKKRKVFYVVSSLIIVGGLASLFTRGLDTGVDFNGGSTYKIKFEEPQSQDAIRGALSISFTENNIEGNPEVKAIGGSGAMFEIVTDFMFNSEDENKENIMQEKLEEGLTSVNGDYEILESKTVAATMKDDFKRDASYATIFSLIIIFLYIFFRFRKWQYGLGALLAMVHDVVIVLSLFSIFHGLLPFTMEINQPFIAAILTVIGYSINDTVVVFDRIREYLTEHHKDDQQTVINRALNSTLSRTINTSLSTFVVLLTIFILGSEDIRGFAFALMVGVIVGTYSSIFIATPSVIDMSKSLKASKA
jgi:SecD/SecF fusion protein